MGRGAVGPQWCSVADPVERELGVRRPNLYDVIVNAPFAE
jgi:hypothetical protein